MVYRGRSAFTIFCMDNRMAPLAESLNNSSLNTKIVNADAVVKLKKLALRPLLGSMHTRRIVIDFSKYANT